VLNPNPGHRPETKEPEMTEAPKPTRAEKNNLLGQLTIAAALLMGQQRTREDAMKEVISIFGGFIEQLDNLPPKKDKTE
jgi:hypothetical protein